MIKITLLLTIRKYVFTNNNLKSENCRNTQHLSKVVRNKTQKQANIELQH